MRAQLYFTLATLMSLAGCAGAQTASETYADNGMKIRQTLANNIVGLNICTSEQKLRNPEAPAVSGHLHYLIHVGNLGGVTELDTLENATGSAPLEQCVSGWLKTLKFEGIRNAKVNLTLTAKDLQ